MIDSQIHLDDKVVRNKDVYATDLDGEIGMIHIETGKYYALEGVSSSIWHLLDSPIQVQHVVDKLMVMYEVDEAICSEQTLQFLNSILNLNLIHLIASEK